MAARREHTARSKLLDQAWVEQFVNSRVERLIESMGNDADVLRTGMRICKQLMYVYAALAPDQGWRFPVIFGSPYQAVSSRVSPGDTQAPAPPPSRPT